MLSPAIHKRRSKHTANCIFWEECLLFQLFCLHGSFTQQCLQPGMHFWCIVHSIVVGGQKYLPLTITDPYIVEITTGFIANTVIDVVDAYPIVGDCLFSG